MDSQKLFLGVILAILVGISALMVRPFLTYVLGAVILAFLSHPVHTRLRKFTGEKISSFLLVMLLLFMAVLPLAFATGAVVNDAYDLSNELRDIETINISAIEYRIEDVVGVETNLEENFRRTVEEFSSIVFGNVSRLINIFASVAIGLSLMVFLLYYFIKDGQKLVGWTREMSPLDDEVFNSLKDNISLTTWAVMKGHVLVAIVQGLVAGAGLYIAGVPNYVFWTFVMVLLAFLPVIGSFMVWGPASIYLMTIDEVTAGVFLLVYGLVVVSLTDNFLRPLLVDKRAGLHPAAIIIGVLGGIYIFGVPGLFIGPILIGVLKSVLLAYISSSEDL